MSHLKITSILIFFLQFLYTKLQKLTSHISCGSKLTSSLRDCAAKIKMAFKNNTTDQK